MASSIEELKDVIRRLHSAEATHVDSVAVKESFQGKTGHPKASRVYAWVHETDNPNRPKHTTVLHVPPVVSPQTAVRAAIIQEFRNLGTAEEI